METGYWSDGLLYSLWKYANGKRLLEREEIDFGDIMPPEVKTGWAILKFIQVLTDLKIELNGLSFREYLYFNKHKEKYEKILKKNTDPNSLISESMKKIVNGKFNMFDVQTVSIYSEIDTDNGMLDFFEFSRNIYKKREKKLTEYIKSYVDLFINDKLPIDKHNYYKFGKQKEQTIRLLKPYVDEYGGNFVFRYGNPETFSGKIEFAKIPFDTPDDSYLFIHSLVAMEQLGYLEINKIWVKDEDLPSQDQTKEFKVNITVGPKLLEEGGVGRLIPQAITAPVKAEYVRIIEIVKHESRTGKIKIIINQNYQSPLEIRLGKYWSKLYDLAEKKTVAYDKPVHDYFNSSQANPLYTKLQYQKTKIIKSDGGACMIPCITLNLISSKKFSQRSNKNA